MNRKKIVRWGLIVFLNIFLFFPYLNVASYPSFSPDKIAFTFCILLIFLSLISRVLYTVLAGYLVIAGTIFLHVMFHWGRDLFDARITTAMESPASERLEYLTTYISRIDLLLIPYVVIGMAGIWFVYWCKKPPMKISWLLSLVPLGLILLIILVKPRALGFPPIAIPLEVYSQPMRTVRLAKRNALIASNRILNTNCSVAYQNVVIVIGESASADHNPLYGYTQGGVSELANLNFTKLSAISGANQTRLSVPLMLTRATAESFDTFYQSPSLVTDMKACGYETYWLSNQPKSGKNDDNIVSISREADFSSFLANESGHDLHYDEELAEKIRLLNSDGKKKAFFVHLIGSHFDYNRRFPEAFSHGSEDMEVAYDKSIRYTDHVLRKIFEFSTKESLLFIYGADHAEVFVDGENGHAFIPSYQAEYRVPLLLWSSDKDRLETLQKYIDTKTVNAESFDHIVRFLVGIEHEPTLVSFDRKVLEASEARVVDYDKLR